MIEPKVVSDVLLTFPADVSELIPPEDDIPEEYWEFSDAWYSLLFSDLFYRGVKQLKLVPREGIDPDIAWRHIRAIMKSYQPKHEHKEAACRFLFDQWFVGAGWTGPSEEQP